MKGTADAEPLHKSLILLMPQALGSEGGDVEYFQFGKKTATDKTEFSKLAEKQIQDLTKPSFYCPPRGCRYQDSPIADALNRIVEQPPDTLGLVVTDLFLSNAELIAKGGMDLQLPLAKALREGRGVGILALKSASLGPIYDLSQLEGTQCFSREKGPIPCPQNEGPHYIGATSRPLFVVIIGPLDRIFRFRERLESDLLKALPDQWRFSIFSTRPLARYQALDLWSDKTFKIDPAAERGDFLGKYFQGKFPGYQLVLSARSPKGTSAELDLSKAWLSGVVPPDSMSISTKSWFQRKGEQRCDKMWYTQAQGETDKLVKFTRTGDLSVRLEIAQPSPAEAGLSAVFDSVMVAGQVSVSGFRLESWLNQWGYNEDKESDLLEQRPTFFPAKNLPRIAKVLVEILMEKHGSNSPPPTTQIGEFRLGLRAKYP